MGLLDTVLMQVAELKQEAGKISNLDLQRKVVRVFYYLCVVTLQYTAPMILILYLSFLYKTLGGGSWSGGLVQGPGETQEAVKEAGDEFQEVQVDTGDMDIGIGSVINQEESVEAIKHQFSLAWNSVKNVSQTKIQYSPVQILGSYSRIIPTILIRCCDFLSQSEAHYPIISDWTPAGVSQPGTNFGGWVSPSGKIEGIDVANHSKPQQLG